MTARLTSAGESGGRHACCFGDVIGVTAGGSAFHYQLFWSFPERRTTGHPGQLWHRHLAQYYFCARSRRTQHGHYPAFINRTCFHMQTRPCLCFSAFHLFWYFEVFIHRSAVLSCSFCCSDWTIANAPSEDCWRSNRFLHLFVRQVNNLQEILTS